MSVETDLLTAFQCILDEILTLFLVMVNTDVAYTILSGFLLQRTDDDIQCSVTTNDCERGFETSPGLLREIPECRVQKGLTVVHDDDCIHAFGIGYEPLGPCV